MPVSVLRVIRSARVLGTMLPVIYGMTEIAVDGAGPGHIAPLIGGAAVGVVSLLRRAGST
jgi:hypothetical protein